MEKQDTKFKIVKESYPSEIVSIIGSILAGLILSLVILRFESFPILILIIPALLSLRGNINSPFIARTARDLIIGEFNLKNWIENILATYLLALITATLIGLFSILLNIFLFKIDVLSYSQLILIPLLSMLITLSISIPISTMLNFFVFKFGLNPNNVIHPIMTAIGDFMSVLCFYFTLIILGVP